MIPRTISQAKWDVLHQIHLNEYVWFGLRFGLLNADYNSSQYASVAIRNVPYGLKW